MKPIRTYPLTWILVVLLAIVLAFAGPRPHPALGRLPADIGEKLGKVPAAAVREDDRMIMVLTFRRDQRQAAENWIRGLRLHEHAVAWVRMPVVDDPGEPALRAEAEGRLLARYAGPGERNNLLPLITNRAVFVQSTGLRDTSQASVLVINRRGDVLARVVGEYDTDKAAVVMDTVRQQEL